jgi:hypothetical protein
MQWHRSSTFYGMESLQYLDTWYQALAWQYKSEAPAFQLSGDGSFPRMVEPNLSLVTEDGV